MGALTSGVGCAWQNRYRRQAGGVGFPFTPDTGRWCRVSIHTGHVARPYWSVCFTLAPALARTRGTGAGLYETFGNGVSELHLRFRVEHCSQDMSQRWAGIERAFACTACVCACGGDVCVGRLGGEGAEVGWGDVIPHRSCGNIPEPKMPELTFITTTTTEEEGGAIPSCARGVAEVRPKAEPEQTNYVRITVCVHDTMPIEAHTTNADKDCCAENKVWHPKCQVLGNEFARLRGQPTH